MKKAKFVLIPVALLAVLAGGFLLVHREPASAEGVVRVNPDGTTNAMAVSGGESALTAAGFEIGAALKEKDGVADAAVVITRDRASGQLIFSALLAAEDPGSLTEEVIDLVVGWEDLSAWTFDLEHCIITDSQGNLLYPRD